MGLEVKSVSLESVGFRGQGESPLSLSNSQEKRVRALAAKALKDARVQAAMAKSGNPSQMRLELSADKGVLAHVGSEIIVIETADSLLHTQILRRDNPLELAREIEARAERKDLGAKITDLSDAQKKTAQKANEAFVQAIGARLEEEGIDPTKKGVVHAFLDQAPDVLSAIGNTNTIVLNKLIVDAKSKSKENETKIWGLLRSEWIQRLDYASSGMGLIGTAFSLYDDNKTWTVATRHCNLEQKLLCASSVVATLLGFSATALDVTQNIAKAKDALSLAASVGGAVTPLSFVALGIILARKSYCLGVTAKFRSAMNAILDQKEGSEKQKCFEMLTFLKQQTSLSALEIAEITEKAKLEGADPQIAMQCALQTKWDRFTAHTGRKDAWLISTLITDELLAAVQQGDTGAIDKAKEIITVVSKSNFLEVGSNVFKLFLTLLSIAALILATLFIHNWAAPVLYIIAAVLSLTAATQKLWSYKLPRLFGFQGVDGLFGTAAWAIREKICHQWYSDRIDRVKVESCSEPSLKNSSITSDWKKAIPILPLQPMAVTL